MIHGNAVFIREAKQAKNTHPYTHFLRTSLLSTAIISQSKKQTTPLAAKKLFAHVIMT